MRSGITLRRERDVDMNNCDAVSSLSPPSQSSTPTLCARLRVFLSVALCARLEHRPESYDCEVVS
eukprot:5004063-Pyramimonas_sp.AAC.1